MNGVDLINGGSSRVDGRDNGNKGPIGPLYLRRMHFEVALRQLPITGMNEPNLNMHGVYRVDVEKSVSDSQFDLMMLGKTRRMFRLEGTESW